jgi:opacity protein-like surface antigen
LEFKIVFRKIPCVIWKNHIVFTTPATVKGHGDSTYKGYGYDLGVGLLCRLSAKIALEGSYVYSHISIDRIETLGYTGKPKDGMESDTREIRVGLNYYFK